jgi:hypothetical protein
MPDGDVGQAGTIRTESEDARYNREQRQDADWTMDEV